MNATGVYQGNVSVAKAVQESINTVAVKVLDMVGTETSFNFMQDKFHIKLIKSLTKGNALYRYWPGAAGTGRPDGRCQHLRDGSGIFGIPPPGHLR